ncbi:tetratricopeptide repeat protein [Rhodothermus bifroesti]|uniref:Tetratricopeptide repeat protein n=1 Tax=Rhodothermus marinus TaxID=29549 RepID=A0A7V2F6V9_RHOMR|nr:tetratricopeptide repeat protein [Rhodothermus bifroesti]GBD02658.1 Beta-barrel assembly-enhancing protease [bacterium HR18]
MALPDLRDALRYIETGQPRQALVLLYPLVERFPAWSAAQLLLARALEADGRWDEALEVWQRLAFWLPESPVVQQGLRRALRQLTLPEAPSDALTSALPDPALAQLPEPLRQLAQTAPTEASSALTQTDDLDIDRLIAELESARIVPRPDLEDIPPPELEQDVDDLVSETLARIYAAQEQYAEAARVYEKLAQQHPERAESYRQRAAEMRAKAAQQTG